MLLSSCFTVRARMAGKFNTTKGSAGNIVIEKSFPVTRDAAACGASAVILGGWCWAYLFMPWQDQQDEMYELADELLAATVGQGKYRLQDKNVKRVGYEKGEPTLRMGLTTNKGDIKNTEPFDNMTAAEELGQVAPPTHPDQRAKYIARWSGEAGLQYRLGSSLFVGAIHREQNYHFRAGTQFGNEQLILGVPITIGGGYRSGLFSIYSGFSLFMDGGYRGVVYQKRLDEVTPGDGDRVVCQRQLPCKTKGVELERNVSWQMMFYEFTGRVSTPEKNAIQGFIEAGASWNIVTILNVRSQDGDEKYGKPLGIGSLYNESLNGIGFNGKYAGLNVTSPLVRIGLSIDFL